jgi:hypothetical protein
MTFLFEWPEESLGSEDGFEMRGIFALLREVRVKRRSVVPPSKKVARTRVQQWGARESRVPGLSRSQLRTW